jgi:hypothetical protein
MESMDDDVILLILIKLPAIQTTELLGVCRLWQIRLIKIVHSDKHKYLQFKNNVCNRAKMDWYPWSKLPATAFYNMVIISAAKSGNLELAKLILRCQIETHLYTQSLIIAIENQKLGLVKLLLENPHTNPTINNNKPLYTAIDGENVSILQLLLEHPQIDPTVQNSEIIRYALQNHKGKMVDALLEDDRIYSKLGAHGIYHSVTRSSMIGGDPIPFHLLMSNRKVKEARHKRTLKQKCSIM